MAEACVFASHGCSGRLQWHHLVSRQRLRRAWKAEVAAARRGGWRPWSITKAIADERNRVWLCVYHHAEVEAKRLYVTAPDEAREFAYGYGLLAELEADESRGLYGAGRAEGAA